MLLYCTFYVSNDIEIKYSIFEGILENPQFATWAASKYNDILEVRKQFKKDSKDEKQDFFHGESLLSILL